MDNRCLERNELACFGVSRFDCKAQRDERKTHSLTSEYVKVTVHMNDKLLITRHLPVNMSLREIKRAVAFHILGELEKMLETVYQYWEQPPFPREE